VELLIIAYAVFVAPWLLAGWFRIPRYVRLLQETDHDPTTNSEWMAGQKAEGNYFLVFSALLAILTIISCCGPFYLPSIIYNNLILAIVINLGVLILALVFAPHRSPKQQAYPCSWRETRFIIIAFLVEMIPTGVSLGVIEFLYEMISDPNNSAESMVLAFGFFTAIVTVITAIRPLTFILTRNFVLLAHAVHRLTTLGLNG